MADCVISSHVHYDFGAGRGEERFFPYTDSALQAILKLRSKTIITARERVFSMDDISVFKRNS